MWLLGSFDSPGCPEVSPALCSDGVVPGRGPQTDVGTSLHASAGGYCLGELSRPVPLMDRLVLHPRRSRVRRRAPGLGGYCPGSNVAGQPHRGGEL